MTAPSRAMISAVARPIPLANAVISATLSVNRILPPFVSAPANAFSPLDASIARDCRVTHLRCVKDEHGRTDDATRDSSAACGIAAGEPGLDQAPRPARRGARAQRRLGQR